MDYRRDTHLFGDQKGNGTRVAPAHGVRSDPREHTEFCGHRGGRNHSVPVRGRNRSERSHAHTFIHRHRRHDRFRPAACESEDVHFGRSCSIRYFHYAHFGDAHRIFARKRGVHRNHRRGGRPDGDSRCDETCFRLYRSDHGRGVFVYGARSHRAAHRGEIVYDEEGTPYQNAL